MFFKMRFVLILTVMSLALSGCGDLLGKKVKKKQLDPSFTELNCELDVNEFADIMKRNISSQIKCLHENLKLFIRVVKSGKQGYLSRIQLERYLAEFRPDVKPEVIRALKSVFHLGHVITGEEPDYISRETIDKVIRFALVLNEEAALKFGPIFQSESQVSYALHRYHREQVSLANKAITGALLNIFNNNRNGQIHKINIEELIDSFKTRDNVDGIKKIKKLLFVKKILLGGETKILTHIELEKLILNFDQLVLVGLDAVRYEYIDQVQEEILSLLLRDVSELYRMVTQGDLNNRDDQTIFTMKEVYEAVKIFIDKEDFDVDKYRNLIGEVKKVAVHGNAKEVKGIEMKGIFNHALSLLNSGTIFYRIWDTFKVPLMSPEPVTISFEEYRHTYPRHQEELAQFERIVKKYRFMKGKFDSPYYTKGYKRDTTGIFEIAMLEYAIKLVMQTYGAPADAAQIGGVTMNRKQMQDLLKKFEPELVELDLLLPGRAEGMADNISLLGTLFQYQSDQNNLLDVNELTEFGVTLLTGLNVQGDLFTHIKEKNCATDEYDRFEPTCFREHFWSGVCEKFRKYYPQMFLSFNTPDKCEDWADSSSNLRAMELLNNSIEAGRLCTHYTDGEKEEIPFSEGDIMTTMIVLMHVETTIMRWDANNNNQLDHDEINKAYSIYGPALDGFLEGKSPIIKKLKKQIYQYLIKYEQVPDEKDFKSIWKFIKFLLNFKKDVTATRKTMAGVLVAIGKENAKGRTTPAFDCNGLRHPDQIPRQPPTPEEEVKRLNRDNSGELLPELAKFINSQGSSKIAVIKAQLQELTEDMISGNVEIEAVKDIRHKDLKKVFSDISKNKTLMNEINAVQADGSEVDKIALAISSLLIQE